VGSEGPLPPRAHRLPQRDERLGWTCDIAAFAPTAAYLYDVSGFLSDWLVDVDLEQSHADGMVPFVVPDVLKYMGIPADFPDPDSTAIWSDAAVWVPWAAWEAYADRGALARQYPGHDGACAPRGGAPVGHRPVGQGFPVR
jgi:alpha-L-rhamnosidase